MNEKNEIIYTLSKLKLENNICEKIPAIVMSNSMYPALRRGQKVFVYPVKNELRIGDIVLYKHWEKSLTIHRIADIRTDNNFSKIYFTKGDNNKETDDYRITEKDIIGIVKTE